MQRLEDCVSRVRKTVLLWVGIVQCRAIPQCAIMFAFFRKHSKVISVLLFPVVALSVAHSSATRIVSDVKSYEFQTVYRRSIDFVLMAWSFDAGLNRSILREIIVDASEGVVKDQVMSMLESARRRKQRE